MRLWLSLFYSDGLTGAPNSSLWLISIVWPTQLVFSFRQVGLYGPFFSSDNYRSRKEGGYTWQLDQASSQCYKSKASLCARLRRWIDFSMKKVWHGKTNRYTISFFNLQPWSCLRTKKGKEVACGTIPLFINSRSSWARWSPLSALSFRLPSPKSEVVELSSKQVRFPFPGVIDSICPWLNGTSFAPASLVSRLSPRRVMFQAVTFLASPSQE